MVLIPYTARDTTLKQGPGEGRAWFLDPDDGVMMDISPRSFGGNSLGANDGAGYR